MLTFTCAVESDFAIYEFCEFGNSGDFADFEISRVPSFVDLKFLASPVLCRDNVMQARKRGRGRRAGARPCVKL